METRKIFYTLSTVVCLLGVSESAWADHGGPHYFTGVAQVVTEGTGAGKVYINQGEVADPAGITEWATPTYETNVLNCGKDGDNHYLYFYAKPDDGSYFWGWYEEETCAERESDDDYPSIHQTSAPIYAETGGTETEPAVVTRYAKFSNVPYPYHWFYAELKVVSNDGDKGRVSAHHLAKTSNYYTLDPAYCEAEKTTYHEDEPTENRSPKTDASSASIRTYAMARQIRGNRFVGWTPKDETVQLVEGYSWTDPYIAVDVISSTTDWSDAYTGEMTATFEAVDPVTVTILKDADRGSVTASVKNHAVDDDVLAYYNENMETLELEDNKIVYDGLYQVDQLTLTATPAEGKKFYGWYTEKDNRYEMVSDEPVLTIELTEDVTYYAYFDAPDADNKYLVGFYQCATWADALAAAKANAPCTILLLKDDEIPAGYYTIPAGVTLLIPKDETQVAFEDHPERIYNSYTYPSAYLKLTLAAGVHLDVFGTIQTGGTQSAKGQINSEQNNGVNGTPTGTYGWLYMNSGSSITLNSGAHLYSWGYVTGQGTIDARRGSIVHEFFQIKDWRGGSAMLYWDDSKKVFPVNQYYIQNIECPITFRPGSQELCDGTVNAKSACRPFNDVDLIGIHGSGSLFEMNDKGDSEDTWVRKSYDAAHDIQLYEINSAARLGSITLVLYGYSFTSGEKYYLPITNNMKIHLLTGKLEVSENAELLPGAEIEVDKEATAYINEGRSLYLFSIQEWDKFNGTEHTRPLPYSPSWAGSGKTCPRSKVVTEDAKFTVHGTVEVHGQFHTTEHGAAITSTNEDAGTIIFKTAAPAVSPSIYVANNTDPTYNEKNATPALLRNSDAVYPTSSTAGTPAGQSYCYMNGKWTYMTVDPTNDCFMMDNYGTYYAKPGAYVPLANGKTENADHTYSDANGQGRLYILMDECQWWEVELVDNVYKGITRDENDVKSWNGKFYEYNNTTHKWQEKRYTITWKDWDGSVITTYQLTYGTEPKYLSTNPSRPANYDYTYDFTGWSPALSTVTGDQIYTATYKQTEVKYTITYKNDDGTILGTELLTRGATPTPPTPTKDGYTLQWNPSIGAVIGDQFYTAEWLSEVPTTWTITWKNYDGSVIATTTPENGATAEEVRADAPTNHEKPATAEYTYSFTDWAPTIAAATANATYTAQYSQEQRTYTVNFYKEGTTSETKSNPANLLVSRENLQMSDAAALPDPLPTKSEAGKTFTLQWKDLETGQIVGTGVPAVSGDADYVADFSLYTVNRYTVSVQIQDESGNAVAGCAATGSGTYDHGTGVTLNVTPAERFLKWADNDNTNPQRTITVEAAQNLTAICVPNMDISSSAARETLTEETKVYNLVLHADVTSSSDLVGSNNLDFYDGQTGHVFFDLTRGNGKVFKNHTWYAFSVPFRVKVADILFDGRKLQYATASKKDDYDILYYDGSVRASLGKDASCWKYIENEKGASERILEPGTLYMIAITRCDVNVIRFTKLDGADLLTEQVNVASYDAGTRTADANWNGIANPAIFKAYMNGVGAAENKAWVYNPDYSDPTNAYVAVDLSSRKAILGEAFFVQTPTEKSVTVNSSDSPAAAPVRREKAANENNVRYQVFIASSDQKASDDIIIRTDEDKEDEYVLGRDLVRMGMSSIRPQMWVNRYDEKLCVNVTAPINNVADYPLGISAPYDGDYELFIDAQPNSETNLYLTLDGEAIWNLSNGAYTATMTKGVHNNYGLRVAAKIPQITTGVEETTIQNAASVRKVLVNDNVVIIRNDNVYSIDGQLIK